jgi:cob(I)alamin adenosyltransferase
MNKLGKIQSITGFGKFKTSSAFGTALRAIDQDWKILIVQFVKGSETGEINIMRKYQIEYWFENNDDSDYALITIEADNIEQAIINFKNKVRLYRKITVIKEI